MTQVIIIYLEGNMNICDKFNVNPYINYGKISPQIKNENLMLVEEFKSWITKAFRTHCLGSINMVQNFHDNPSNSC